MCLMHFIVLYCLCRYRCVYTWTACIYRLNYWTSCTSSCYKNTTQWINQANKCSTPVLNIRIIYVLLKCLYFFDNFHFRMWTELPLTEAAAFNMSDNVTKLITVCLIWAHAGNFLLLFRKIFSLKSDFLEIFSKKYISMWLKKAHFQV